MRENFKITIMRLFLDGIKACRYTNYCLVKKDTK